MYICICFVCGCVYVLSFLCTHRPLAGTQYFMQVSISERHIWTKKCGIVQKIAKTTKFWSRALRFRFWMQDQASNIARDREKQKEIFDGAIGRVCDIGDKADIWGYSSIHVRMLIIYGGLFFAHPVFWSCVRMAEPSTTSVATESLVLPRLLVLHCGSSTDIHALGRKPKTTKNKTEQNLAWSNNGRTATREAKTENTIQRE